MNHMTVASRWAAGLDSGKTVKAGNVFAIGDTLYSYGTHFPIARRVETKSGIYFLFTAAAYSITPARHIGLARRAASKVGRILSYYPGPPFSTKYDILKFTWDRIAASVPNRSKWHPVTRQRIHDEIDHWLDNHEQLIRLLKETS